MGAPRKHGNHQNGAPVPLGDRIPYFDGTCYTCDRYKSRVFEKGAFVWLVNREFHPCAEDCTFADTCPTRDQLKRDTRSATFVHVNVADTPQKIRVTVPRLFLETQEGKKIELEVPDPYPGTAMGPRFTNEGLEYVQRQLLDPRIPVQRIADLAGTSRRTIDRIKAEFMPQLPWEITLCIDPSMTCLRIDEIYIPKRGKNRKAYTLLFDGSHSSFIGLIPGTSADDIGPALAAIRARCNIVAATMDFGEYVPTVKAWFPGIKITGDKFHLIQRFQEIMDGARKKADHAIKDTDLETLRTLINNPIGGTVSKEQLKKALKKIAKSGVTDDLEEDLYLFKTYIKRLTTPNQKKIRSWLKQMPALRAPYFFLQHMYQLLNREDILADKAAEEFWHRVGLLKLRAPDAYAKAEPFLRKNQDLIEAYFETHETNARAEAFNRQIRLILAFSRGLQYQELIRRLIILYSKGAPMCPLGAPDELENVPPFLACTDQHLQASLRHGKHAPKLYPLEDPDPQATFDFDSQDDKDDLPLG